jgi:hypothetical protein
MLIRRVCIFAPAFVTGSVRLLFIAAFFSAGMHFLYANANADSVSDPDPDAAQLGRRVLAVEVALGNPSAPGSLQAVRDLGLDSRYYVLVRGWLAMQLEGDRSIVAAKPDAAGAEIKRRIEFIERALRAIDLE